MGRSFFWVFGVCFLFFLIPLVSATEILGCCIDTQVGCREIFSESEQLACINAGFDFDTDSRCWPNPLFSNQPVTSNVLCQAVGCCEFPDGTFENEYPAELCRQQGANFRGGVCGIDTTPQNLTCSLLNGYWCTQENRNSLSNILTQSRVGAPSSDHFCYDIPCVSDEVCPTPQLVLPYEICTDGIDNTGNCLVDGADPTCQATISGIITDTSGRPLSNVRVKITNLDHGGLSHVDVFTTYTVGSEGRYFFQGVSQGTYRVEVDDSEFILRDGPYTLTSSIQYPSNTHIDVPILTVIPIQSRSIRLTAVERINNTNQALPGALIILHNTPHFGTTNSSGQITLSQVRTGRTYVAQAFKEGYLPSQEIRFTLQPGQSVFSTIPPLVLRSEDCAINLPPPRINQLVNLRGEPGFIISFNSTDCEPREYHIFRCDEQTLSCDDHSDFSRIATINSRQFEYTDRNLLWDNAYAYYVAAIYGDSQLAGNSQIVRGFTGDEECAGRAHGGSFCEYEYGLTPSLTREVLSSTGYFCNARNMKEVYSGTSGLVICSQGTQCVETNSGTAQATTQCRAIEECGPSTNNYFGLFFSREMCQGAQNTRFCVFDTSRTTVDFCYSATMYGGCGDYKSRTACQQNIAGVGSCEWVETNPELNLGICRDTIKNECSACNSQFNAVFGACTQQACTAFGDCSLSTQEQKCISCAQTTCYDYGDELSCTGGSSQRPSLNFFNNQLSARSQDICGLGNCVWDSQANLCYKDADVDGRPDCDPTRFSLSSDYTVAHCLRDSIRPETVARFDRRHFNPLAPIYGEIVVDFHSTTRLSRGDDSFLVTDVYFCITGQSNDRCRDVTQYDQVSTSNGTLNPLVIASSDGSLRVTPGVRGREFILSPGSNILKFYAKDKGSNLEIVKEEIFYVDTQKPVLDITILQLPDFASLKTDLSVFVNANKEVYCQINLNHCEDLGNCDLKFNESQLTDAFFEYNKDKFTSYYKRELKGISDGSVALGIQCIDLSGNIAEYKEYVFLDTDSRIQNPLPLGVTDRNSVTLSVDTDQAVECRYTQSINQQFSQIPNSQRMSRLNVDGLYRHSAQVSVQESRTYTYYIRCNYDPVALQTITFTKDSLPPEVIATTSSGIPIHETAWLSDSQVFLECRDEPEFGFGCAEIRHCLVSSSIVASGASSCIPTNQYNGSVFVEDNAILCYNAIENTVSRNGVTEGGLSSQTVCVSVRADSSDPILIVDTIPATVNINQLSVSGAIYETGISVSSISFSEDSSYKGLLEIINPPKYYASILSDSVQFSDFSYAIELDLDNLPATADKGTLELLYGHTSPTRYNAFVIDFESNTLYFKSRGLTNQRSSPLSLDDSFFNGKKSIRLRQSNNGMVATIQDLVGETITYQTSGFTASSGQFGVLITDETSSRSALFNALNNKLSNPQILLGDSSSLSDVDKTIYLTINNRLDSVVRTNRHFTFNTKLTQGVPRHGDRYDVSIFSESPSGRQSLPVKRTVIYDLSGPNVKEHTISPTRQQNDTSYIEYLHPAHFSLLVEDDYSGVSRVIILVDDVPATELSLSNGNWEGVVPTENVPIGNHTVRVEMYDGIGNRNIVSLENALRIENREDPKIVFSLNKTYFSTETPNILLQTDVPARCTVTYRDASDQLRTLELTGNYVREHSGQLQALASQEGREISTDLRFICTDRGGNTITSVIPIVIDKRPPVYSVLPYEFDLAVLNKYRHLSEYRVLRPSTQVLTVFSDEPVKCRYTRTMGSPGNFQGASSYRLTDETSGFFLPQGRTETFTVICTDRAGNDGIAKQVRFTVDENAPPSLLHLPEVVRVNAESGSSIDISFESVRPLVCEYTIGSESGEVEPDYPDGVFSLFRYTISLPSSVSSGNLHIDCTRLTGGSTVRKTIPLYNDRSVPMIQNSGSLELGTITAPTNTVNSNQYSFSLSFSETVHMLIYNDDILVGGALDVSSFNSAIPLRFGLNNIRIEIADRAGNLATYYAQIISEQESTLIYFTDFFGGSIRDSYYGSVLSSATPELTLTSLSTGESIPVSVSSSGNYFGMNEYAFELSSDVLFNISQMQGNLAEITVADVERIHPSYWFADLLELRARVGATEYTEVILYHPLAENLEFEKPRYHRVSDDILENFNQLQLRAFLDNQNYMVSTTHNGQSFDLHSGLLRRTIPRQNVERVHEFSLRSDLGVITRISQALLLAGGFSIELSLYPDGQVTTSNRPSFKFTFGEPAKVIDAYVSNNDLSKNYSIASFGSQSVLTGRLNLQENLDDFGTYHLTIVAETQYGVTVSDRFEFRYQDRPFTLKLIEPKYGFSRTENFVAELHSSSAAICAYSTQQESFADMTPLNDTYATAHFISLSIPDNSVETYYFRCQEQSGSLSDLIAFEFGTLQVPPQITSASIRNSEIISGTTYILGYPLAVMVSVNVTQDAYCRYSLAASIQNTTTNFSQMQDVSYNECSSITEGTFCFNTSPTLTISNLEDNVSYFAQIVCQNKAGLNSNPRVLEFTVDTSKSSPISIISPGRYIGTTNFTISVETSLPAESCTYGFSEDQITQTLSLSGNVYSASSSLDAGERTLYVKCIIDNVEYVRTSTFLIDLTPPVAGTINHSSTTASRSRLEATAQGFSDPESGIELYEYAIGTARFGEPGWNNVVSWTPSTSPEFVATELNLEDGTRYYWSVRARNNAQIYSQVVSSSGILVDSSDGRQRGEQCTVNTDCIDGLECISGFCDIPTVEPEDPFVVEPSPQQPSLERRSRAWIFWLLLLGLLLLLLAGGYYWYTEEEKKKKRVPPPRPQQQVQQPVPRPQQQFVPPPVIDVPTEDRKDALKRVLKKMLHEQQGKSRQSERDNKFKEFNSSNFQKPINTLKSVEKDSTKQKGFSSKKKKPYSYKDKKYKSPIKELKKRLK